MYEPNALQPEETEQRKAAKRLLRAAFDQFPALDTATERRNLWLDITLYWKQLYMPHSKETLNRADIHIRDPFVLPLPDMRRYVLYGTTYLGKPHQSLGFDAYLSVEDDLERWEGPFPVLRLPEGFWGTRDFWATEVHHFNGRYYMLASLAGDNRKRGTQAFVSEDPLGPFAPVGDAALTPPDWDCLDGTLFVENETPYLVFCHEWTQINDGTIDFVPLAPDLSHAIGPPVTLFHGSDAPWAASVTEQAWTADLNASPEPQFVTDGPTLFRTRDNQLRMLWSTHGLTGYVLGVATSQTGTLAGPWTQAPEPVFAGDGGHGMLFRDFDENLRLALHQPNSGDQERAHFFHVAETDDETTGGLALSTSC